MGKRFKNGVPCSRTAWSLTYLTAVAGLLGLLTVSMNAQTQQSIFPVATQINLSGAGDIFPSFVGDFNGDGIPDIAYVLNTSSENTLEVQLSFASSAPPAPVTTSLCSFQDGIPQLRFGDVDHDGKLDLVFSCNGYVVVQFGNGDGTFQSQTYYANGAPPVLVDLNGDGYLDIAYFTNNSVAVLTNQGAAGPGIFNAAKLYAAPNYSTGLTAGDFNGDGKQDLIYVFAQTTDPFSIYSTFSILYGNGDGTLNAAKSQSPGNFTAFTTGDFNGDGVTDVSLVLSSAAASVNTSVQILLGSKSGTFSQGSSLPLVATVAPGSPVVAVALTGDGNLDLLVVTSVLNVFRGDGKGGFIATGSYAFTAPNLFFADVNDDGHEDVILVGNSGVFILDGNGDGTFRGLPGTPINGPAADVNNDGIADIAFLGPLTGNTLPVSFFGIALGRGDGTFSILNQTTQLPSGDFGYLLIPADFNGDGKIDMLAVQDTGSNLSCVQPPDSQLLSFLGNGDGSFQVAGKALDLGVVGAAQAITGDFNGDGKLDVVFAYTSLCGSGLVFVPGHGDGTFGASVNLNGTQGSQYPSLLIGDMNNDKKLDFIWGDAVFLGNGDGTFRQIPLTIPADNGQTGAITIADLNGDGILDAVSAPGVLIYAGKGDGTFQSTPFYSVPLPEYVYRESLVTGDVNGDGNPDLLVVENSLRSLALVAYLGDGHGNFTQDTNEYALATTTSDDAFLNITARLNNQAPALSGDGKLDILVQLIDNDVEGGAPFTASLLNQLNPAPMKPAPLTSSTVLQAAPATADPGAMITLTASVFGTNPTGAVAFSANGAVLSTEELVNGTATLQTSFANAGSYAVTAAYQGDNQNTASTSTATSVTIMPSSSTTTLQASLASGDLNQQITLTASVSGDDPSGKVTFSADANGLGTATVTGGVASLQTSFAAAGTYHVTATYAGDSNNTASASSTVTITIVAPDFTIAATPTSASIAPGQTATFTFTASPVAGYSGTVNFSCGTLPSLAACSFAPTSVSPSGGSAVSTRLTVTTTAATAMLHQEQPFGPSKLPWVPAGALAMAGAFGLVFTPKKTGRCNRLLRLSSLGLLFSSFSLMFTLGCGGGSGNTVPSSSGTPAGSYTVPVNASDASGGSQHTVNITLSVQ